MGEKMCLTECTSLCKTIDSVVNESFVVIGYCLTSIPQEITSFYVGVESLKNHSSVGDFNRCGFGFVVKEGKFKFSSLDLLNLPNRETVLVILDWAVGYQTCLN
jgi:hypothetical protein